MKVELPPDTAGWVAVEEAMAVVMDRLNAGPYLLGDRFTAADILYGTTFALFKGSPLMSPSPVMDAYVDRIISRPAYQRAMQLDEVS